LGFALPHPLMPGASPMVDDLDMVRRLEDAGASAIVMHSLFEEQIAAEGHTAGYVAPFGEALSLYLAPANVEDEALVMLSDILPTGFEGGVLNGQVRPGDTVAIVGAGPIGLAVLLTARFYSPSEIIMIDLDDNRLETATRLGATRAVHGSREDAARRVMEL